MPAGLAAGPRSARAGPMGPVHFVANLPHDLRGRPADRSGTDRGRGRLAFPQPARQLPALLPTPLRRLPAIRPRHRHAGAENRRHTGKKLLGTNAGFGRIFGLADGDRGQHPETHGQSDAPGRIEPPLVPVGTFGNGLHDRDHAAQRVRHDPQSVVQHRRLYGGHAHRPVTTNEQQTLAKRRAGRGRHRHSVYRSGVLPGRPDLQRSRDHVCATAGQTFRSGLQTFVFRALPGTQPDTGTLRAGRRPRSVAFDRRHGRRRRRLVHHAPHRDRRTRDHLQHAPVGR